MAASPTPTDDPDPSTASRTWVVGVDGSEVSRRCLRWAATLAARRQVTVSAVRAWHDPSFAVPPVMSEAMVGYEREIAEWTRQELDEAAASVAEETGATIRTVVARGSAAQVLLAAVERADLAVVGSRGQGAFARLVLGSVSQRLAHHSERPTVIVPPEHDGTGARRLVVGVDGSANSRAALLWAHRFAPDAEAITALGAWQLPLYGPTRVSTGVLLGLRGEAEADFERVVSEVEEEIGEPGRFTRAFEDRHPGQMLVERGADSDLLVVGARGHAIGIVLGSVANWVIHHLTCPTAVIRSPEGS